ncbi:MAG: hypothetical protein HC883_01080 [Bdellovibrionaceae bacterium]|nr:hypothetical protein [Pseudobdellovibrionaceae bacterium]
MSEEIVKLYEKATRDPNDALVTKLEEITPAPITSVARAGLSGRADDFGFFGSFNTGSSFADRSDGVSFEQIVLAGAVILAVGYFLLKGK